MRHPRSHIDFAVCESNSVSAAFVSYGDGNSTSTIANTPLPTDTVPAGEPTSTPVPDTPTPEPTFTLAPPGLGQDWTNGCISTLWKPYPPIQMTENNGCLSEPIYFFFAADGRLTFLVNGRFDNTQVYGMFAPLPANGTASIKVFLRNLQDGEIWTGVFTEPTLDSQGMVIVIPPGDVKKRMLVQKSMPGQIDVQQTQPFEQNPPLYDIVFEFSNGSITTKLMNNSAMFDPITVNSAQQWLFVGFQVQKGSNRIDAEFLDLVIQEQ